MSKLNADASFVLERLGETIMDSAFARTLRSGIKGVAMVLDHEVQPLTRALPLTRAFYTELQGCQERVTQADV